ncbi:MAG: ABC transporter substrate-binding protein [Candidatus Brocadiae bacterium]|nr:ABC transporter substrate-binding protein [Candidatus Brocadiia bacterium]
MKKFQRFPILFFLLVVFFIAGCPNTQNPVEDERESLAKAYNPVFPQEKPFNPSEWETAKDYEFLGDPNAKKGGTLRSYWMEFVPTLRTEGPNTNLQQLTQVFDLVYERLLQLHPTTLEYIPRLAEYWQISEDKQNFRFRLNPKARWADGSEITSDDVVASWEHNIMKDRKDPYNNILYEGSYEKPVIEDKYTFSIKTKKLNWRLFLYFAVSMKIYPAKYLRIPESQYQKYYGVSYDGKSPLLIPGEKYLEWYQWKMMMGSGPYALKELQKERSLTLERRQNYWGEKEKWCAGKYNFDRLRWYVISDESLQFEKLKKGDLDYFFVVRAIGWAQECDFDKVLNGWVLKKKVFTQEPQGFSGFVFNMRRPPFHDKNVRLAFAYLFNREKLIDKLFFNQYDFIDSYYPGSEWGNPNNLKIRYNPEKAAQLLAEAGWKERNSQGWLIDKDGNPFEITLEFGQKGMERIFTVIQEDFQKAGIKMDLKLIDYRTLLKKVEERNFTLHYQSWSAIIFPNPESSWMSEMAEQKHNNNLPGFANARVDELCKEYNIIFDRKRQMEIIQEIDGIIFQEHPYALGWYANFNRMLYWNKFGYPKGHFTRIGDYLDIPAYWWIDPEKEAALENAIKTNSKLPPGELVDDYWITRDQKK